MPKKPSSALDLGDGYRLPAPLPAIAEGDPWLARVERFLHDGGGEVAVTLALREPDAALRAFLRRYLALPAATDLGAAPWDQHAYDALTPAEKRARSKKHRAAAKARSERGWGLFFAVEALRGDRDGRALALARFADAPPAARFEIVRALWTARDRVTADECATLAALFDADVSPETIPAMRFGAWAAIHRSPPDAWDRLAPHLAPDARATYAGRNRATALLQALRETSALEPRWSDTLRPLLADPLCAGHVAWAIGGLALDARWVDPLLGYLHTMPGAPGVCDLRGLAMLVRVADARCVEVFGAVLRENPLGRDAALDGLSRCLDARARAHLRDFIEARRGGAPDDPAVRRAEDLLARSDHPTRR